MSDTYFLMHFLEGEEARKHELHVTLLAHLYTDHPEGLLEHIGSVLRTSNPVTLQKGELETFGDAPNLVTVMTLLDPTGETQLLHENLLLNLPVTVQLGQPHYTGKHFRPHITLPEEPVTVPERITLDSFTLVRHVGGLGGEVDQVHTFRL